MKKTLLLVLAAVTLTACQTATKPVPTKPTTPVAADSSLPNRVEATVPELNLTYTYDATVFQKPVRMGDKAVLYRQGEPAAGAGTLRLTFNKPGEQPEYETWLSDFAGEIVTESTVQTLCDNARWPKGMFVQCRIMREPIPHAEFYVGMALPGGTFALHKAAVFPTGDAARPGLFIDTVIEDAPADLLDAKNEAHVTSALEQLASGKANSRLVTEFNRVVGSVTFE